MIEHVPPYRVKAVHSHPFTWLRTTKYQIVYEDKTVVGESYSYTKAEEIVFWMNIAHRVGYYDGYSS